MFPYSPFDASEYMTLEQRQRHREWKRQWFRKFEKTLDTAQSGLSDSRMSGLLKGLRKKTAQTNSL